MLRSSSRQLQLAALACWAVASSDQLTSQLLSQLLWQQSIAHQQASSPQSCLSSQPAMKEKTKESRKCFQVRTGSILPGVVKTTQPQQLNSYTLIVENAEQTGSLVQQLGPVNNVLCSSTLSLQELIQGYAESGLLLEPSYRPPNNILIIYAGVNLFRYYNNISIHNIICTDSNFKVTLADQLPGHPLLD